jgi:hypothetical protein
MTDVKAFSFSAFINQNFSKDALDSVFKFQDLVNLSSNALKLFQNTKLAFFGPALEQTSFICDLSYITDVPKNVMEIKTLFDKIVNGKTIKKFSYKLLDFCHKIPFYLDSILKVQRAFFQKIKLVVPEALQVFGITCGILHSSLSFGSHVYKLITGPHDALNISYRLIKTAISISLLSLGVLGLLEVALPIVVSPVIMTSLEMFTGVLDMSLEGFVKA